jgi:hypothetical protein
LGGRDLHFVLQLSLSFYVSDREPRRRMQRTTDLAQHPDADRARD